MKKIKINKFNLESILNSYLYDAKFEPENIKYNKNTLNLELEFERIFFEDISQIRKIKIFPFINLFKYPIIKSMLHLEGIIELFYKSHEIRKYHIFEACFIKENTCFCFFNTLFEMNFKFLDNLGGYLEDINFVNKKMKRYFSFFTKKDFFYNVREELTIINKMSKENIR